MKWLSVKKYKPPEQEQLFVFTSKKEYIAAYVFEDSFITSDCCADRIHGVTHFCIPDPIEIEEE